MLPVEDEINPIVVVHFSLVHEWSLVIEWFVHLTDEAQAWVQSLLAYTRLYIRGVE
jgi:hypothetical protein